VGDLVVVTVLQCLEQDDTYITSFLLVIVTLLHNTIKQLSPKHFLCNEIVKLWLLKDIVKSDNVLVLQFFEDGNFILESYLILLGKLGLGHNLNSERIIGLLVRSLLYDREGTLPKLVDMYGNNKKVSIEKDRMVESET
jgi:hypothetical protein